ncbi:MAG: helix-turn-helix domain-containing protein [Nitrosopumilaceae archaeon]|nr:transposase [Nitrosopumilaceae archaeon]NIU88465.1 helix-turn-helix domain-containing protein [Nitrosopumilaceae archaeon]NIV66718.1 helix-turn-helix domain-containing protein [Nitrosopumilaceae archaeon]NIX62670.1 helix-turn-helix domain-containing protein [Nitrosopumilaceae archaeon]
MSREQRYLSELSESDLQALKEGHKTGKSHTYRCRCKAILLSYQKWSCDELASFFEVSKVTIYSWLERWERGGISALSDKPGRGRNSILKLNEEQHVKVVNKVIDRSPSNMNKAVSEIEKELGLKMSKKTLKRFLKNLSENGNDTVDARQVNQSAGSTKQK